MRIAPPFLAPAWWQSGYVADCKSVNAGSIPAQASTRRPGIATLASAGNALPKDPASQAAIPPAATEFFRSSSAVEQATVNRRVAGSIPASGATIDYGAFFPGRAVAACGKPRSLRRSGVMTKRRRSWSARGRVPGLLQGRPLFLPAHTAQRRHERRHQPRGVRARPGRRRAALRSAARRGRPDPPVPRRRLRRGPPSLDLGGGRRDHRGERDGRGHDPSRDGRGSRPQRSASCCRSRT